jgi:sporulation protein YlmC with PRC-barrel domain
MEIPVNAQVKAADGSAYGRLSYVVLDPKTKRLTHLVVKADKAPHTERLVSIDQVMESTPRLIRVRHSLDELDHLPEFIQHQYVREDLPYSDVFSGEAALLTINPYTQVPRVPAYVPILVTQMPRGEIAVRRGAHVAAEDGPVGTVDDFLIDPKTDRITHLVLRHGHLWGQRDISLPVGEIAHIAENTVYLKLSKRQIEQLPAMPVAGGR